MEDIKPRVSFSTSPKSILKPVRRPSEEPSASPLDSRSTSFSPSTSSSSRQPNNLQDTSSAPLPPITSSSSIPPSSMASRLHTALMSNEPSSGRMRRRSTPPPSTKPPKASTKKVELWEDDKGRKGEIWCHGCGERVAGLLFACLQCLSFELCLTCFPKLDSSLQHPSHHHFQLQVHPLLASRLIASTTPILLASQTPLSSSPNLPTTPIPPASVPREPSPQLPLIPRSRPNRVERSLFDASSSSSRTSKLPPPTYPGSLPALHLYPTSEAFEPKFISLPTDGCRIIIGRRKAADPSEEPSSCNGYFDGKVLSRSHAEVWFEDGKFLIRDLGSLNGIYLASERLAPFGRGLTSEPRQLHSDDLLDFGSAPGHKISCKVQCVLTSKDEKKSFKALQFYHAFNRRLQDLQTPTSSLVEVPAFAFTQLHTNPFPLNPIPIPTPPFCDLRTHSPVQLQPQPLAGQPSTVGLEESSVMRYILVDEPKAPSEWEEDWSDKESVPDPESS